jgi:hypothetical protein
MQSWADCITGTHESSFWKRQGFVTVYIELIGLIILGGYIISSSFAPIFMPNYVSFEHALQLYMQ